MCLLTGVCLLRSGQHVSEVGPAQAQTSQAVQEVRGGASPPHLHLLVPLFLFYSEGPVVFLYE